MPMMLLSDKYSAELYGVLNCYDCIIIIGNVHPLCYPKGMTRYLYAHGIRVFDYTAKFAEPLRNTIRANAETVAAENSLE
jgi:hypothetical protein